MATKDVDPCHQMNTSKAEQRQILRRVLLINLVQAVGGIAIGIYAASTGLIGAGLDNLADASVYAVGLYAVGRPIIAKVRAARLSGCLLLFFASLLLVEVVRRYFYGAEPIGVAMIAVAAVNIILNQVCLRLLARNRSDDVNFKASVIFTNNDTWANLGLVISGVLVWLFASPIPDLAIGLIVALIALKGGREILLEARETQNTTTETSHD